MVFTVEMQIEEAFSGLLLYVFSERNAFRLKVFLVCQYGYSLNVFKQQRSGYETAVFYSWCVKSAILKAFSILKGTDWHC